jgi:hypothetical protein
VDWNHEKHFENLNREVIKLREKTKEFDIIPFLDKYNKSGKIKEYFLDRYNKIASTIKSKNYKKVPYRKNLYKRNFINFKKYKLSYKLYKKKFKFLKYNQFKLKKLTKYSYKKKRIKNFILNNILKLKENTFILKQNLKTSTNLQNISWFFNHKFWFYKRFKEYNKFFNIKSVSFIDLMNIHDRKLTLMDFYSKITFSYIYILNFFFYYYKYFVLKWGLNKILNNKFFFYKRKIYWKKKKKIYWV